MKDDGGNKAGTFIFLCVFCGLAISLAASVSLGVFSDKDAPSGTSAREIAQGSPSAGANMRMAKAAECAEGRPCNTFGQFCFPDPKNQDPETELYCDMTDPRAPKFRRLPKDGPEASRGGK